MCTLPFEFQGLFLVCCSRKGGQLFLKGLSCKKADESLKAMTNLAVFFSDFEGNIFMDQLVKFYCLSASPLDNNVIPIVDSEENCKVFALPQKTRGSKSEIVRCPFKKKYAQIKFMYRLVIFGHCIVGIRKILTEYLNLSSNLVAKKIVIPLIKAGGYTNTFWHTFIAPIFVLIQL
jgi:hypothetical protein